MWPFRKSGLIDSVMTGVMLEDGVMYPVVIENNEVYEKGLETMKNLIARWILQDLKLITDVGRPIESSLSYSLRNIDVKFLPFPSYWDILLQTMKDTDFSHSGSRFFDTIANIYIEVPTEVIRTFIGKFLYGMIYGLPKTINDQPIPTKEDWTNLLAQVPWAPFLQLVQTVLDGEIDGATTKITNIEPTIVKSGSAQ